MELFIDSTVEELTTQADILQNVLNENNADKRYWLEALLPALDDKKNPYKNLPNDKRNEKQAQWMEIYQNKYRRLKDNLLKKILDSYLADGLDDATYQSIKHLLKIYVEKYTGPVAYKAGLIMAKYGLTEMVLPWIAKLNDNDEYVVYESFSKLHRIEYQGGFSEAIVAQLVAAMKEGLSRRFINFKPYYPIFALMENLSAQHPEAVSQLQDELVPVLDLKRMDARDYGASVFRMQKAWPHIKPFWTTENTGALLDNLIAVTRKEPFHYVYDNVFSTLKVIGADEPKAQETIEWFAEKVAKAMKKGR
ncbi:hypothetical protein [Flavobacterium sp.]|uniref:hypothetical protein n=1 Tax=Flavobacterium sp. TaxID=239 RepID=UPI0039E6EC85